MSAFLAPLKPLLARLPLRALPGPARFVFCYHDISEPGSPGHSPLYSTSLLNFRRQLDALSRRFTWKRLDRLVQDDEGHGPQAALAFDDGFASVLHVAAPELRQRGIPFAVFACRSAIEDNFLPVSAAVMLGQSRGDAEFRYDRFSAAAERDLLSRRAEIIASPALRPRIYLTAAELRQLAQAGTLIGSHTANHRVLARCTDAELQDEIAGNQIYLKTLLGEAPRHLAIPYGKSRHFTPRALEIMAAEGIESVYLTESAPLPRPAPPRAVHAAASPGKLPRLFPRISILDQTPAELAYAVNRALLAASLRGLAHRPEVS